MATTLSRNLRLRINSSLTADAKYNLERLDLLGSTFLVDTRNGLNIRSEADISIEPESADIGGSGTSGIVQIGNSSHSIAELQINANLVKLNKGLSLLDQAPSGTGYLALKYNSTLNGTLDSTDRTLSIDLQGADRQLILGGSFRTDGADLELDLTGPTQVVLPLTGTLATLSNVETLTNKSIDSDSNNIRKLRTANIASNAGIEYSKLDLTGSIVNSDVASGAAVAYSKLALTGHVVDADISTSAAIQYSKLLLTGSVTNSDISSSAAIQYNKLDLTASIVNADLSPSFAIDGSNIDPNFGSRDVVTTGSLNGSQLNLAGPLHTASLEAASSGQSTDLVFQLPATYGSNSQVLTSDGSGGLSWTTPSGSGTVVSYNTVWITSDGSTKTVVHGLSSTSIEVSIQDQSDGSLLLVNSIIVTDSNTITLTSSEAPGTSWLVTVQA